MESRVLMVVIKNLLIGAAVAVSTSAIAMPAFAATLRPTNIQFTTNGVANTTTAPNLNTWTFGSGSPVYDNTGIGGVNRRVLNDFNNYGDMTKAAAALSDEDSATNVELWTKSVSSTDRTIYDNVGFTAMLGDKQVKVESVTKADWADGRLANSWLTGFRTAYSGLMQGITTTPGSNLLADFDSNYNLFATHLTTNGFNELGDANIGGVSFDDQTHQLKVDLVGHLDAAGRYVDTRAMVEQKTTKNGVTTTKMVANSNYLKKSPDFARNTTGLAALDNALFAMSLKAFTTGNPFQVSEVAKVTYNGQTDYAFSFAAIDSGAIAGDRNKVNDKTSHTGLYTWVKTLPPPSTKVPEPTAMLGLIAVSGLAMQHKRRRRG
jgi:hypothetical protein